MVPALPWACCRALLVLAARSYKYPGASHTILFSHGNATDCGHMRDQFVDLCVSLRVNVAAYEYGGYGVSTGTSSASAVGIWTCGAHSPWFGFTPSPRRLGQENPARRAAMRT